MTEDEEWQELERKQRESDEQHIITEAQVKATEFINDHASELGIMTLRKAFEIGYRRGAYAETRRQDATDKS